MAEPEPTADAGFLRHPFTLLVCGWLLTGVLGTWFTTCWDRSEKARERRRVALDLELKQRVALFEETTTAVAETFTAAEDVLSLFEYGAGPARQKEVAERLAFWKAAGRAWRTHSKVLGAKLAATYNDPRIAIQFQEIINTRRQLGNDIANHLAELAKPPPEKLPDWVADGKRLIQQTTGPSGTLRSFVGLLRAEIKTTANQTE